MGELQSRQSHEWQKIFDALVESVLLVDLNHVVVRANRAAYQLLAADNDELVGKKCAEVFACDADQCKNCPLDYVKHANKSISIELESHLLEKDLRVTCAPLLEKNQLTGFIHTTVDITPQRNLEKQLVQAQKMKAISTLAGGIAHDFNNILGVILGNADLLLYRLNGDISGSDSPVSFLEKEDIKEHLSAIQKAGHRAQDLVSQILTFSRQASSSRKKILLAPMVKESVKFLKSSLPSTINLRVSIDEDVGYILGDPTQIHQVLMNICANAVEAIGSSHGQIDVTLEERKISRTDLAKAPQKLSSGEYVVLSVQDTGVGMSEEVLERIFDPFFTTREVGEGNGLGLAVLHGIVTAHNAALDVQSEPGKGTLFTIFFPKVTIWEEKDDKNKVINMSRGKETIIFVDDEESIVVMYTEMLEFLGYTVIQAFSGEQVLTELATNLHAIDLVITDQTMPQMTGLELAFAIKKISPALPIILCSGYTDPELEITGKEAGISTFLAKPIDMKDLAVAIRQVFLMQGDQ